MSPAEAPVRDRGITGAKEAVKQILDRHPETLKDNKLYHAIQKRRALRGIAVRPELTERKDLLASLERDGIVVVPDYFQADDVAEMLEACERLLADAKEGSQSEHVFHSPEPGVLIRIAKADTLVPRTGQFFEDDEIASVMRAYMSPDVVSYRHEIDFRYTPAERLQSDLYHFDNWRPICKAFLYLADVGDENAPFTYVPGSHVGGPWRTRHERAFDAYGEHGPGGCLLPQEWRYLQAEYGFEDLVCTGRAGTLILADFRGLHRGTPLQSGRRVLLNNTFDLINA